MADFYAKYDGIFGGGGGGGGTGDVVGPSSATDNAIARFDGTTGKLIQNSTVIVDDSGNTTGIGTLNASGTATLGNVIDSGLTANTVPYANGSKQLTSSAVTPTELGYVSGVTSSIQTQLNSKQATLTIGDLTDAGTDGIVVTGGVGSVIGAGTSLAQHVSDATHNGYLSSTDWVAFNAKQASGNYITSLTGGVTASGPGAAAATVVTNANLTGVITSVGNATSIASQTGTGTKFVVDTSPTLVTPLLGTPQSGVLTNCTGLPLASITGLGTNVATFLATPTSANLAAAVTDETGSGALVMANTPTLVTPILGTPTSGTLTNCTGLPVAGGGTGIATTTAYSVICAGTTATAAFQSLAALGASGTVLTSNGAGALPSFQTAGAGNFGAGLYRGEIQNGSASIGWRLTGSTEVDFPVFGVPVLTVVGSTVGFTSISLTQVSAASVPGITFTAPNTGKVKATFNWFWATNTGTGDNEFYMTDASNVHIGALDSYSITSGNGGNMSLTGILAVTATTAYSIKLRGKTFGAGNLYLGAYDTNISNILSMTLEYVG